MFKSFVPILKMGCIRMKLKKVYLLAGVPGSGKSTWIRSRLVPGAEWISRDNVRFAILSDEDDYFAHEDDVFDTFINYINQTLDDENIHTIYIDATHLNKRARDNVLRLIHTNKIEILNSVCLIHMQSAKPYIELVVSCTLLLNPQR